MTPQRAKELLPLIQAFAEGKTIQYQYNGRWVDCKDPNWTDSEYRIKPNKQSAWVNLYRENCGELVYEFGFTHEEKALKNVRDVSRPRLKYITTLKLEWEE